LIKERLCKAFKRIVVTGNPAAIMGSQPKVEATDEQQAGIIRIALSSGTQAIRPVILGFSEKEYSR
jgi:hypothetical protein